MIEAYKTNQEVFDIVAKHLLTQNQKSLDGYENVYRSHDGLKCAIGILFPDDMYHNDMEGINAGFLKSNYPDLHSLFINIDDSFLSGLQAIHDAYEPPSTWKNKLIAFASYFKLDTTVLDQFN